MHRHACGHGHYWDCEGSAVRDHESEPTVCMCLEHGVPMESGDHSECSTEILTCSEHRSQQTATQDGPLPAENGDVNGGFVRLSVPDNVDQMLEAWSDDPQPSIGFCFLCGHPIRTRQELIHETSTHDCPEGEALEASIASQNSRAQSQSGV